MDNLNTTTALVPAGVQLPPGCWNWDAKTQEIPEQEQLRPAAGFGQRLAAARENRGTTQRVLARQIEQKIAVLRSIESGTIECDIDLARTYASVLGVDMLWLWLGREPAPPAAPQAASLSELAEIDAAAERARQARQAADAMPSGGKHDALFSEASAAADDQFVALGDLPVRSLAGARRLAAALMERQRKEPDGFNHGCVENAALRLLENLAGEDVPARARSADEAALLALHDRFIDSERRVHELHELVMDDDERDAAKDPIEAEQWDIAEAADRLRATTLDGIRARARMWLAWDPDAFPEAPEHGVNLHHLLLRQLMRDLLSEEEIAGFTSINDYPAYERAAQTAVRRDPPAVSVSPDADLIRACDMTIAIEEQRLRLLYAARKGDRAGQIRNEARASDLHALADPFIATVQNGYPSTPEGCAAYAQVIMWQAARNADGDIIASGSIYEDLAITLASALAGGDAAGDLLHEMVSAQRAA